MKKVMRKELLAKRDGLTEEEILHKSASAFQQLKSSSAYSNANNVMVYLAFRNEVSTEEMIKDLFNRGKRVFIPLTVPETKQLIISELLDMEKDLEIGNFGVLEPIEGAIRPVDPQILDLVIVPGVGFDPQGYRVGYGGGYYDRFLPRLAPNTPTVALAFEVQLIEEAPTDEYDFPVEYVVTEKQFMDCKKNRQ
ncbi:5-formyltetrahydrofolate cyclo-ligase [Clostridium aceticum]|uniref:5-formyltetrahydrofolate cyclo-ligase n=1 Tax=Clostridium aceticum TaxID=84022 RepID=A0A0D8IC11_9CLOT|nr:5-formyltetrahydrofolate cyclo-ligase [Clostridium aceticum]AKL96728.1 5-formyltetrahydrofolate cyclo-ligase [Clostridium aceticum]KJF27497.1 5-formyltetrahydrofolate cyclo-ligase [Clostridium aceticum]